MQYLIKASGATCHIAHWEDGPGTKDPRGELIIDGEALAWKPDMKILTAGGNAEPPERGLLDRRQAGTFGRGVSGR